MSQSTLLHDLLPHFVTWFRHAPESDPIKRQIITLLLASAPKPGEEDKDVLPSSSDVAGSGGETARETAPADCNEEPGLVLSTPVVGVQGFAGHCRNCGLPAVVVTAPASWGGQPLILDARGGSHPCCCGGKNRS